MIFNLQQHKKASWQTRKEFERIIFRNNNNPLHKHVDIYFALIGYSDCNGKLRAPFNPVSRKKNEIEVIATDQLPISVMKLSDFEGK